jgi:hypothetical protein
LRGLSWISLRRLSRILGFLAGLSWIGLRGLSWILRFIAGLSWICLRMILDFFGRIILVFSQDYLGSVCFLGLLAGLSWIYLGFLGFLAGLSWIWSRGLSWICLRGLSSIFWISCRIILDLLGGLEDYLGFLSKNNLGFLWD